MRTETQSFNSIPNGFSCYTYALKNYANFSGRASRKEFWLFILFNALMSFLIGIVSLFLQDILPVGILSSAYQLFILIPSLAVASRRLHDMGK